LIQLEKTEYDGEDLDLPKEEALSTYLTQQEKVLSLDRIIYLYRKCLSVKVIGISLENSSHWT